jgi:hypothetical protein
MPEPEKSRSMKPYLLLFALLLPLGTFAQSYSIDWYTVDGGGGTSTGGVYSVTGTIGQSDAGVQMNGGPYSVTGGFWSLIAVQVPGAPLLSIRLTSTNTAILSWLASATGYNLQQTAPLGSTNWLGVTNPVNLVNGEKEVTVTPRPGNKFFRLSKP